MLDMSISPRLSDSNGSRVHSRRRVDDGSLSAHYHRSPAANMLRSEDSVIELLGGIANLQYNYKPVMPDLYMPFRDLEPLGEKNPQCELALRKQRRLKRKQPRLPKESHIMIGNVASTPPSQGFSTA